jgi:ABC-type transport system involved in multi-copper enzyme maturation permease subunit
MNKILAIGRNTFREAIRDKILYAILIFALLMLFVALAFGELSGADSKVGSKVTKDLGMTFISLFGVLIAIFTGVSLVHKEIDKRTLYTVISKPIRRYQFIVGKYLGMLYTALAQIIVLSLTFAGLLMYQDQIINFDLFKAIYLYWLEIMLIISVALFFSSFTTPFFSGFFTFCIFLIGRLMPDIHMVLLKVKHPITLALLKLSTILPNLQFLNISHRVVHNEIVPLQYLWASTLYVFFYILIFLTLGALIFRRRDFI